MTALRVTEAEYARLAGKRVKRKRTKAAQPAEQFKAVYDFRLGAARRRPSGDPCWHRVRVDKRTGLAYCDAGC